jgi:bifunctional UDP-N-acetylglucosamine pyrophosphorylase/glucosamine-1-phosphate N-acetyltransferase
VVGKYKSIIEETIAQYIHLEMYNIQFVLQPEALGTGHAIQCCVPELSKYGSIDVLILSGDVPLLKSTTMLRLLYNTQKAKMMITELENPTGYGRIVENNEGIQIVEEKDCTLAQKQIAIVNTGIYAIQNDILCQYIGMLSNKNTQQEYYLTDVIQLIQDYEKCTIGLITIPKENQMEILGVNTAEQLNELNASVLASNPLKWL